MSFGNSSDYIETYCRDVGKKVNQINLLKEGIINSGGKNMKWILLVWFAYQGNYSYIPVIVAEYTTREYCIYSGDAFVKYAGPRKTSETDSVSELNLRPRYTCLPKR
jgi:hypothetical protein